MVDKTIKVTSKEIVAKSPYDGTKEIHGKSSEVNIGIVTSGVGGETIPNAGKSKYNEDQVGTSELLQFSIGFNRSFDDSVTTPDEIFPQKDSSEPKIDVAMSDDQSYIGVDSAKSDSVDTSDVFEYFVESNRVFDDPAPAVEELSLDVDSVLVDAVPGVDTISLDIAKAPEEVITTSDVIILETDYRQEFSDEVEPSDDILSAVTGDDEQNAEFTKVIEDVVEVIDEIDDANLGGTAEKTDVTPVEDETSFDVESGVEDNIATDEELTFTSDYGRETFDEASTDDELAFASDTVMEDIGASVDEVSFEYGTNAPDDVITAMDLLGFNVQPFVDDYFGTNDDVTFTFDTGRLFEDLSVSSDEVSVETGKSFNELQTYFEFVWFDVSTGVEEVALAAEDFSMLAETSYSDVAVSTDEIGLGFAMGLITEVASSSDTSSIIYQQVMAGDVATPGDIATALLASYFAEDYSLEDYTGSTYTLT